MKKNIIVIVAIALLLLPMISSAVEKEEWFGPSVSLDFDETNNTVIFNFYNPNEKTTMKGQFIMKIGDQREIIESYAGPNENFRREMKPKTSGMVHLSGWYQVGDDRYPISLSREISLQNTPAVSDYNQEIPETPGFETFITMISFVIVIIAMRRKK